LDRCALFVDASYALGDGALAVHGTRNRDSVSWDYAGLLKLLGGMSRDRTGLPLLRCYWYDTSADGNRSREHDTLADIPGVKLRLVKIRPNRKEGVEAEIRKDLTALARNHAISDVIIVSAEEDLAPVIAEVQDLGIRAILLTIATDGDWAASRALSQECDDLIEVSPGHLRPYVDLISGAEPQLAASGYRELAADQSGAGERPAAIEAPAQRLYPSPLPTLYEGAAQPQFASLSGHREQQHSQDHPVQQPSSGQQYQQAEGGRELLTAGSDQGFRTGGYPTAEASRQASQATGGFGPHSLADDGRAVSLPGSVPMGVPSSAQPGAPGQNGLGGAGPATGSAAPPRSSIPAGQPDNGLAAAMPPGALGGLPAVNGQGTGQPGLQSNGLPAGSLPGPGGQSSQYGTQTGSRLGGGPDANPLTSGYSGGSQPQAGAQQNGMPQNGMPQQAMGQFGGAQPQGSSMPQAHQSMQAQSMPAQQMPAQPMQVQQMPGQPGQAQPGRSAGPGAGQGGVQPAPQSPGPGGQQLAGQGLPASAPPRHVSNSAVSHAAVQSNGMAPVESSRPLAPERQPPAGNGVHYSPDGSAPYGGGPLQPSQFAGPPSAAYGRGSYGGPPAVPSTGLSVGDAVQSAHAEGFGFGEAVARDAPALWLEAVLARKPRMPSDLEARLLQGSALPIDSLLHDEVRHALRRGFWDALERSRH